MIYCVAGSPTKFSSVIQVDPASGKVRNEMRPIMRKPVLCICANIGADQLCSNCAADQRLCFSLHR